VPDLTVAQNIFLGREIQRRWAGGVKTLDRAAMNARASELFAALGLRVPSVTLPVQALSGGQQQAVAIARATGFDAKLVIMDEPTANLGAPAIEKVRETIIRLKESGVAVIIISHRLEDIFAIGDAITVMKQGQLVAERAVDDTDNAEVVEMIITGRDPRGATSATNP
jgi:simple sugar transport system ATP-binding protein